MTINLCFPARVVKSIGGAEFVNVRTDHGITADDRNVDSWYLFL